MQLSYYVQLNDKVCIIVLAYHNIVCLKCYSHLKPLSMAMVEP